MSKSILVIDTPETCLDCMFCRELHEGIEACCELSDELEDKELCRMIEIDYCQEKPDWCPLKEMIRKTSVGIEVCIGNKTECVKSYVDGYNACIDEILKLCYAEKVIN